MRLGKNKRERCWSEVTNLCAPDMIRLHAEIENLFVPTAVFGSVQYRRTWAGLGVQGYLCTVPMVLIVSTNSFLPLGHIENVWILGRPQRSH
jgi:hypothetical protein